MSKKYSYNELKKLQTAINRFLSLDKELDINLIWTLRQNLNEVQENLELFDDMFQESVDGFNDYLKDRFNLMESHGAKSEPLPNGGRRITDTSEMDKEKFLEDFEELKEEYEDMLEKEKAIQEKNNEKAKAKTMKLDLQTVSMEQFGSTIKPKDFPQEFLEFVVNE